MQGGTVTASAQASSGLSVTISSDTQTKCTVSGTTVSLVADGICTLRGTQTGNSNFNAATATIYTSGNHLTGLTGMTPGARQYLATTAGARTETAPSTANNVVQMVGVASSASSLIFEPEEPVTVA